MAKKESVSSKSIETLRKKRPVFIVKRKIVYIKQVNIILNHTQVKEDNEKINIIHKIKTDNNGRNQSCIS